MKFEVFDHTGDLGIRFFGRSYEELISSASWAMAYLMGRQQGRRRLESKQISVHHDSHMVLLYEILSKILYEFEVNMILYSKISFPNGIGEGESLVQMEGFHMNGRFRYNYVIKSPTFHMLELNPSEGYGTVVLDI